MTILFATSTGNAEDCATRAASKAVTMGFKPAVINVRDFNVAELTKCDRLLLIASTWGEGEPPDDAISFWEEFQKMTEGSLSSLRFAVFALGDSSYEHFCGFGQNCDAQFEKLGASRVLPCKGCDLDYDDFLEAWFQDALGAFSLNEPANA